MSVADLETLLSKSELLKDSFSSTDDADPRTRREPPRLSELQLFSFSIQDLVKKLAHALRWLLLEALLSQDQIRRVLHDERISSQSDHPIFIYIYVGM